MQKDAAGERPEVIVDGPQRWQIIVLWLSCLHSGLWGVFIMGMPDRAAIVYGLDRPPDDLYLWQGTGLFITLLALGYGLAAKDLAQHWGLVLIGLLAKTAGALGMSVAVLRGQVPASVLLLLPINDVIWWWPFYQIVRTGRKCRAVSCGRI